MVCTACRASAARGLQNIAHVLRVKAAQFLEFLFDLKFKAAEAGTVIFGYPQTNMVSNLTVTGAEIQPCDYYWLTKDTKPAK